MDHPYIYQVGVAALHVGHVFVDQLMALYGISSQ